jgi:transcriptional regulator with GAF, ATPase, and Fis domain
MVPNKVSQVELAGDHPAIRAALDRARAVAPTSATVLLLGETGSGKGVLAATIHRASGRRDRFVALNCGAVAPTLLESELFGHERGAFTGAACRREGKFEAASGGTLFLDEIDALSAPGAR